MHIEIKQFIYFITPHSKRVCAHGLECPYGAYIFISSLFFYKSGYVRGKLLKHIIRPYCAYAVFINETPDVYAWTNETLTQPIRSKH